MTVTVELKNNLVSSGFEEYPPIAMEDAYDKLENPPPYGKFIKPIQKATKDYDRLWSLQLSIIHHFAEFPYIYKTCFTDRAFYYMLEKYAHLELEIKEFLKELKSTGDQKVKEYYTSNGFDFQGEFNINVFDLLREDFEKYRPIAEQRYQQYVEQYGDDFSLLTDDVTDYFAGYKDALKKAKKDRAELKKKQQAGV